MKERVKTAKGRRLSSTTWLKRQLNDPYVKKASSDGYPSRAAYKLIEINDKHNFLKSGTKVLDLGAAPGGWSKVSSQKVGISHSQPHVAAVDIKDITPLAGVKFYLKSIYDEDLVDVIKADYPDGFAVILSDMAPSTTGHKDTDHLKILDMAENAFEMCNLFLEEGGVFLLKLFKGRGENEFVAKVRKSFTSVAYVKPPSSRKESSEIFLLAKGFKKV